jgi:hypothetical protein
MNVYHENSCAQEWQRERSRAGGVSEAHAARRTRRECFLQVLHAVVRGVAELAQQHAAADERHDGGEEADAERLEGKEGETGIEQVPGAACRCDRQRARARVQRQRRARRRRRRVLLQRLERRSHSRPVAA